MTAPGFATGPVPLPTPPQGDGKVTLTFNEGSAQTFRGEIRDDIYPATVVGLKGTRSTFGGKLKEQIVFLLAIDGREGDGELAYYTGTNVTSDTRAKLPPFLKALGLPLPTPQSPELPNPIGKRCKVFVSNEPSTKDPSRTYPKITKVLPA